MLLVGCDVGRERQRVLRGSGSVRCVREAACGVGGNGSRAGRQQLAMIEAVISCLMMPIVPCSMLLIIHQSVVCSLFAPCVQTYTYAIIPIREVCKARPISHIPGLEVGDHSSGDHAKSNPDRQVSMEDDSDIISYEVWGGLGSVGAAAAGVHASVGLCKV